MTRIVLISILFTMVYSWEELKRAMRVLFYRLLWRKAPAKRFALHLDQFVGTLVILATIPISLAYFLASQEDFFTKLGWLALSLLIVCLVAAGSGIFLRRLRYLSAYDGLGKVIPLVFSVTGLFSPLAWVLSDSSFLPRIVLAKLSFFLSLPLLVGLLLKYSVPYGGSLREFLPHQDLLIFILIIALLMRVAVEFLEFYFRFYRLEKVFSYFRVLLGIILAAFLLVK